MNKLLGVALSINVLLAPNGLASSIPQTKVDPISREAAILFSQDRLQEAAELQQKAVVKYGGRWLPHAAMAFYMWQQGNAYGAVEQGKLAAKLAPKNEPVLLSLAQMNEALDDCRSASELYTKCISLAPQDAQAHLGLARCYTKLGKDADAVTTLNTMRAGNHGFDWYYPLAKTYFQMGKYAEAHQMAEVASKLAGTAADKAKVDILYLTALLKDAKFDLASSMYQRVLVDCKPKDYEVYVLAADLLSPESPESTSLIVSAAQENLKAVEDAEGFFRLGRVLEEKASAAPSDKLGEWGNSIAACYRQAILLQPQQGRYHLALAGALSTGDQIEQMKSQLELAKSTDFSDTLASFILSHNGAPLNLKQIDFEVRGLNCGCHVSKLESYFCQVPKVAFASVIATEPYRGSLLVESSAPRFDEILSEALNLMANQTKLSVKDVKTIVLAEKPISTVRDAVVLANKSRYGDPRRIMSQFDPIEPALPLALSADTLLSSK